MTEFHLNRLEQTDGTVEYVLYEFGRYGTPIAIIDECRLRRLLAHAGFKMEER